MQQFKTIKNILDSNSQVIFNGKERVKAIDCRQLALLLDDIERQRQIMKVDDEDFILVKRAVHKVVKDEQSDDFVQLNKAKKQRKIFKKHQFLN